MAQAVTEVPESQAEGKLKALYEDIKQSLRVPWVPYVFRALALHPDYLSLAWSALKPNAQTAYFERHADLLRQTAVEAAARLGSSTRVDAPSAQVIRTLHYAAPKVFLASATLRSATNGSQPQMEYLPPDEKRQIPSGIPQGAFQPGGDQGARSSDEDPTSVLGEMRNAGIDDAVLAEISALQGFPSAFDAGWATLKPAWTAGQVAPVARDLRLEVERSITSLPFRMDIGTHSLLQGGLSHSDVDDVRERLDASYAAGPVLLLFVALLSVGLDGRDAAMKSPFPV